MSWRCFAEITKTHSNSTQNSTLNYFDVEMKFHIVANHNFSCFGYCAPAQVKILTVYLARHLETGAGVSPGIGNDTIVVDRKLYLLRNIADRKITCQLIFFV